MLLTLQQIFFGQQKPKREKTESVIERIERLQNEEIEVLQGFPGVGKNGIFVPPPKAKKTNGELKLK